MTRQRETPEPGDWIVYTRKNTHVRGPALGGPWTHGKLIERKVGGWNVKPIAGSTMFVLDDDILRITLSRGEAIDIADKLEATNSEYVKERAALKPRFEQRIRDLLNN